MTGQELEGDRQDSDTEVVESRNASRILSSADTDEEYSAFGTNELNKESTMATATARQAHEASSSKAGPSRAEEAIPPREALLGDRGKREHVQAKLDSNTKNSTENVEENVDEFEGEGTFAAPFTEEELRDVYRKAKFKVKNGRIVHPKCDDPRQTAQDRPMFGFGSTIPPVNFTEPPLTSAMASTRTLGQNPRCFNASRRALIQKLCAADYWLRILHRPTAIPHPSAPPIPSHSRMPHHRHSEAHSEQDRPSTSREDRPSTSGEDRPSTSGMTSDNRLSRSPLLPRKRTMEDHPPEECATQSNPEDDHTGEEARASHITDPLWSASNGDKACPSEPVKDSAVSHLVFDEWYREDQAAWEEEFSKFATSDLDFHPSEDFFSFINV